MGMGGGGKRHANKDHRTLKRTINKGRWDDICANELRPERLPAVTKEKTALDPDLPGLGQYYCVCCSKYCITSAALEQHYKTTKHKRRFKTLTTEEPYSHAEANAAAGRGSTDVGAGFSSVDRTKMSD